MADNRWAEEKKSSKPSSDAGTPSDSGLATLDPGEPPTVDPPQQPPATAPSDPPKSKAAAADEDVGRSPAAEAILEGDGGWRAHMTEILESWGSSLIVHLVIIIVLGLLTMVDIEEPEVQIIEMGETASIEEYTPTVDPNIQSSEAATSSSQMSSSFGAPTMATGELADGIDSQPSVDQSAMERASAPTAVSLGMFSVDSVMGDTATMALGTNSIGQASAPVADYKEALHRIAQDILAQIESGNDVLAMWLFDQSESMKDDQQEIRDNIDKVYYELGLTGSVKDAALLNAVCSYGERWQYHLKQPTGDLFEMRQAMDQVPVDETGKEMMMHAIASTVQQYSKFGKGRNGRVLMMIVLTDESGDPDSNLQYLEPTLQMLKENNCRMYFLGREAVFGYPYAHMRWQHPFTKRVHWLPVDRGPETPFVEQLQTSGFHRRYDAHPSGFGPYEQIRMARETNGVFLLLPSVETNLVRGERRIYELEAMKPYLPDLRSRAEYLVDRNASILRSVLWKVINDLNPYDPEKAKVINLRTEFSPNPESFAKQVQQNLAKAEIYVRYLRDAQAAMEKIEYERRHETSARWRANYDLIYGQLLAYEVRIYEYGAYLTWFMQNPKIVPLEKPPNLRLVHWDIRHRKELMTGTEYQDKMDRASAMFDKVIYENPGTPWAARAEQEKRRAFGIELIEDYDPPHPPRGSYPDVKPPKL